MMRNIVGKLFFMCIMVCSAIADPIVTLRVTDRHGRALAQTYAGEQFNVEASVTNFDGQGGPPQIKGVEQLQIQTFGERTTIMNGDATHAYVYTVCASEPGTYTIGPALLERNGVRSVSGKTSIEVVERPEQDASAQKAFLAWSVTPQRVVVGQKVMAHLRFYYQDDSILLDQLEQPNFAGFDARPVGEAVAGTDEVDGVSYRYAQWTWELYPQEAGVQTVPGIRARGVVERAHDFWSFFGQRKAVVLHAAPVELRVDELPIHEGDVDAVGTFTSFNAAVDQAVAQEGEGIVLKFALHGQGNLEKLQLPPLKMPDVFTWYDSKQQVTDRAKTFEFIVQGTREGTWEIPEQTFKYFDVNDRRVKQLSTEPLMITITPRMSKASFPSSPEGYAGHGEQFNSVRPECPTGVSKGQDGREGEVDGLAPLDVAGKWYPSTERALPRSWLLVMMLLPLMLWCVYTYQRWQRVRRQTGGADFAYKVAFSAAHAQLEKIKQKRNAKKLYDLFKNLCAARWRIPPTMVQQRVVDERLQESKFSAFFTHLAEIAFSDKEPQDADTLFEQATVWLQRLQEVL